MTRTRDHFEIITDALTRLDNMTPGTSYHLVRAEPGSGKREWAIYRTEKGAHFQTRLRVSPALSLSRLSDWVDGAYGTLRAFCGTVENDEKPLVNLFVDPLTLPAPVVVVWEQVGGNVEITGAGRVEVYYAKFGEGIGHCKKHGVDSVECEKDADECQYYTDAERETMIPEHARHTWIALTEV